MKDEQLLEWMAARRSTRHFREEALEPGMLRRLIAVATTAPSAHNAQPWRFVVVHRGPARERLAMAMAARFRLDLEEDGLARDRVVELLAEGRARLVEAPALVAVCLARDALKEVPAGRRRAIEHRLALQGVAAAVTTLLLAAHAEGLAGYWLSAPLFAPGPVRRALRLPAGWEPQAFVLLGYPAVPPGARACLPLETVLVERGPA